MQVDAKPRPYRVTGVVGDGPGAAFFTAATAAALYGHPGQADALAVLGGGKVDEDALREAVPGLTVAAGAVRGDAEDLRVAAARPDIVEVAASLGGVAVMTMLVVVGGLIVLSVRERAREFALLRAVGATPGQVRGRLVRETAKIGAAAALAGGVLSVGLGAGMHAAMVREDVLPDGFGLSLSPLPALAAFAVTLLAAVATAFLASPRVSGIRPVEALGEAAAEPAGLPRWRVITGVAFLVVGLNALGFSVTATGPTASASAGGLVIALIIATALLGPLVARLGNRVLGGAARAVSPVAGRMARHAAGAAALRAGSLITPVALAVAFAGRPAVRADHRRPRDAGAGGGRRPRRPGRRRGRSGASADRRRGGAPHAGRDRRDARQAHQRDHAGRGAGRGEPAVAKIEARVVAVYDRGLGFGDVLLPRDLVAAHSPSPLDDHVLVRGNADLGSVTAAYAGTRVVGPEEFGAGLSREIRLQGFVGRVVVAAILLPARAVLRRRTPPNLS
ncbi:ABC transporter permease [Actinomadura sp. 3N407]|uniref:ABC transporter permease n=1 Tax=Actinomadura sp. 3N407 TaxID=3457423 RepID=UPI003FCC93E2